MQLKKSIKLGKNKTYSFFYFHTLPINAIEVRVLDLQYIVDNHKDLLTEISLSSKFSYFAKFFTINTGTKSII